MIAFIQVETTGGTTARIRVDEIRAVMDGKTLQLTLGGNLRIPVENETIDTLWSKMGQAAGHKIQVITMADENQT